MNTAATDSGRALEHDHVSSTKEKKRDTNIDLLRLIAAFGVINIHTPFTTEGAAKINAFFLPLGVPFFFLTSLVYFLAGLKEDTSLKAVIKRTFKRILLPYLAWTVIYVLLMVIKHAVVHKPNNIVPYRVLFYGESAVHLYFLPQLVAMQMLVLALYFMFNTAANKKITGAIIFIMVITYYTIGNMLNCFGITPLPSVVFYIVSACVVVAVINDAIKWVWVMVGFIILILPLFINSLESKPEIFNYINYLPTAGLALVLLAIGLPQMPLSKLMTKFTNASFGIYLCHVVFLEAILFTTDRFFPGKIVHDFLGNLVITFSVFILSAGFTMLLSRVPVLRNYFLGIEAQKHKRRKRRTRSSKSPEEAA
jgi:peptidoglycan/LPS O-acetylase OafA/YrhL